MFNTLRTKIRRFRMRVRGWISSILGGTPHHYWCFLPGNIGWFSNVLLKIFYYGIRINPDQIAVIQKIPKDAIIVYANKYKSYFQFLFYHTRYRQLNIPFPEIGFDYKIFIFQPLSRIVKIILAFFDHIRKSFSFRDPYKENYFRYELLNGRVGFVSLLEEKGFYLRFVKEKYDPLKYLIQMQQTIDRPIYIVPQLMFFSTNPHRSTPSLIDILFGTEEKPGKLRLIFTLFRNPGKIFVEVSDPVNIRDFIEREAIRDLPVEQQASELRQFLISQINRHRQSITGPILKSVDELKESILTSERLRSFMENYIETRNIPPYKVHKEANDYLDEIAAQYSPRAIRIFSTIVKWITGMMFEGLIVNMEVLNKVKTMARNGPLVFVPCHKSHIDYLILSYTLYCNQMPCPHIAAGKNLSFWPLGPIFRKGGAFFIRRTFKGAVLYSKVFSEYVYKLLEEGFNIEFFIEGGRSRTGKLLQPKLGFLSILLNALKNGACNDLIFVPVYIGYDRVPEESAYLYELEGGQKKPENLWQIFRARKALKKRYGKIYLQFHEPISLNDVLYHKGNNIKEMSQKEFNTFCRYFGNTLLNSIDKMTIITPHAVVASALLNCPKSTFTFPHLLSHIETYMNYLYHQNIRLADTLTVEYERAVEYVFQNYLQRRLIESVSKEGEASGEKHYAVNTDRRTVLEYYKNNCIIAFIPAAFTALAILEKDAFQFSAYDLHKTFIFLQELFQNEFSFDYEKTPEIQVRKNLKAFIDDAILMPHPTLPDTYNLTSIGFRKLKLFSRFLKTYFESYWIVLTFFSKFPQSFLESKNRQKKILSLAHRMYKRKEIERKEALSGAYLKTAEEFFISQGIRGSEDIEKIEKYAKPIQRYLGYLQIQ